MEVRAKLSFETISHLSRNGYGATFNYIYPMAVSEKGKAIYRHQTHVNSYSVTRKDTQAHYLRQSIYYPRDASKMFETESETNKHEPHTQHTHTHTKSKQLGTWALDLIY